MTLTKSWKEEPRLCSTFCTCTKHFHCNANAKLRPGHWVLIRTARWNRCNTVCKLTKKIPTRLPNTVQLLRKKPLHFATVTSWCTNKEPGRFASATTTFWDPADYSPQYLRPSWTLTQETVHLKGRYCKFHFKRLGLECNVSEYIWYFIEKKPNV